jgi:hypothetical protein
MTGLLTDPTEIGQRRDASKPPLRPSSGPSRGVVQLARAQAKQRVPPAPPRYKKEKPENIRWLRPRNPW